jgi:hypothetical protein
VCLIFVAGSWRSVAAALRAYAATAASRSCEKRSAAASRRWMRSWSDLAVDGGVERGTDLTHPRVGQAADSLDEHRE